MLQVVVLTVGASWTRATVLPTYSSSQRTRQPVALWMHVHHNTPAKQDW